MAKVAFFVDGHFLFNQVKSFQSFFCDGPNIRKYCERHLSGSETLYRIFYYDAPPLEREGVSPLGTKIDFSTLALVKPQKAKLQSIVETPYMALRLGKTTWQNDWKIKQASLKAVMDGTRNVTSLTDDDFVANITQKAVDMKIGLDIATVAYKKLADRVVLIAGDADFVPAAKLARVEGLHVTLDPLGKKVPSDLIEHVDFLCTQLDRDNPADVKPSKKSYFVPPIKSI